MYVFFSCTLEKFRVKYRKKRTIKWKEEEKKEEIIIKMTKNKR
jgi:hypothetical protein